tara:strand:- start:131 stop:847 length:717 start_codon:yes stop_codon:yes gene_type:complete
MTKAVIINKNGDIEEVTLKDDSKDNYYKLCKFRKADGFEKQTTWNINAKVKGEKIKYQIELWARDNGKANTENKYDFPPPVDNELFFGNCLLVNYDVENNTHKDISKPEWKAIYERLFGGFEDLDDTANADENEEDELENIPVHMKTKQGYLKDNFVVDDEEEEIADIDSEESEATNLDEDAHADAIAHEESGSESGSESGAEGESDTEESDTDETDDDSESTNSELVIEDYEYSDDE